MSQSSTSSTDNPFPNLKVNTVRTSSMVAVVLGICAASIPEDIIGRGVYWIAINWILAGCFGISATQKQPYEYSNLVATAVVGCFSIATSIVTSIVSGKAVGYGLVLYNYLDNCPYCHTWFGLECTLLFISIASLINSIIFTRLIIVGISSNVQEDTNQEKLCNTSTKKTINY